MYLLYFLVVLPVSLLVAGLCTWYAVMPGNFVSVTRSTWKLLRSETSTRIVSTRKWLLSRLSTMTASRINSAVLFPVSPSPASRMLVLDTRTAYWPVTRVTISSGKPPWELPNRSRSLTLKKGSTVIPAMVMTPTRRLTKEEVESMYEMMSQPA